MPSASASSLDQSSPDPSESSSKRSSGSGACQWGERALSAERAWLPCARGLLWAHVQRVLALGRFGAGHTSGGLHGVRGCARRGGEAACAVKGTGSVLGSVFQHKQGVDARLRERLHTALRVAPHRRLALALDQQPARHGDGGRHAASALRERRVRQPYPLGLKHTSTARPPPVQRHLPRAPLAPVRRRGKGPARRRGGPARAR